MSKNCRAKKGVNDKPYRIEDELTPKEREIKRRNRNLKWRNKVTAAEQVEMSVQRGKLYVEGQAYEPRIRKPDTHKLLKLKEDEIEELCKQVVIQGLPIECETSIFKGFVSDVQSFEEVNKAYEWVKFHNLSARHVVAACRVPGNTVINSACYYDDDEHGAGVKLLEYMESANLENRALFIAREYDGQHIGQQRFECMINAAKSAVNQKPFNTSTNTYQFSWQRNNSRGGMAGGRRLRRASKVQSIGSANSKEDSEVSFGHVNLNTSTRMTDWAADQPADSAKNTAR